ncbi:MAG TPA: class I SAM-dependent methyltransferase [Trebonia sp.]|nr:class I SAM-dependent methyltransferase [Trebonia sp.]
MRLEGEITRGTTNPSRLRRVDRWITQAERSVLIAQPSPLVVDLGYGASPVTTLELYRRVLAVAPTAEVVGLEIDPGRVAQARARLAELRAAGHALPGLSFAAGGFELPVSRRPAVVRAFNVLRQYPEERAWTAWRRLTAGLAPGGVLVEGTCDEIGRRAVWVTLPALGDGEPLVTFSARLASLQRPSDLAERLPKVLIHRNLPGEPVHQFLRDWDRAWDRCAPQKVFGPRQRWLTAISLLRKDWPVLDRAPHGGQRRWRLGEITVPWKALAPLGRNLSQTSTAPIATVAGRCHVYPDSGEFSRVLAPC